MGGEYLLDTNIVIALIDQQTSAIGNRYSSDEGFISAMIAGELLYGSETSTQRAANQVRLERWLTRLSVLPCDLATAQFYASIRAQLKRDGRPVPDNDIWIAATAMQHGLTLVTRDAHFEHVESLQLENWQ